MNQIILNLSDDELELLHEMTQYGDVDGDFQSPEMEALGEKIRNAIEDVA